MVKVWLQLFVGILFLVCIINDVKSAKEDEILNRKRRIIGGSPADLSEFPWAILMKGYVSRHQRVVCGGTLINERWLITAAHCFWAVDQNHNEMRLKNPRKWKVFSSQFQPENNNSSDSNDSNDEEVDKDDGNPDIDEFVPRRNPYWDLFDFFSNPYVNRRDDFFRKLRHHRQYRPHRDHRHYTRRPRPQKQEPDKDVEEGSDLKGNITNIDERPKVESYNSKNGRWHVHVERHSPDGHWMIKRYYVKRRNEMNKKSSTTISPTESTATSTKSNGDESTTTKEEESKDTTESNIDEEEDSEEYIEWLRRQLIRRERLRVFESLNKFIRDAIRRKDLARRRYSPFDAFNLPIMPISYSRNWRKNVKRTFDGYVMRPKRIFLHPFYRPHDIEWDIAVVELEKPLNFSSNEQLSSNISDSWINVPRQTHYFPRRHQSCVSVGWGCRSRDNGPSRYAMQSNFTVFSHTDCDYAYDYMAGINQNHEFCAGFMNRNIGVCPGDSGSGLYCKDKTGKWTLAGVVSATHSEKPGQRPGVFTRVSYFSKWINRIMEKSAVDN